MVTHGVPLDLRKYDTEGNLYCAEGTDGCDMVYRDTGLPVPFANFYTQEVHNARIVAMQGNKIALQQYETWYNSITEQLPCVFHYSWIDIKRKIRLYKSFWTRHWTSLVGQEYIDTATTNMFFDVPWDEVTDEMIEKRARELEQIGGWIFHRKWDGTFVPWIACNKTQPKIMQNVSREKSNAKKSNKT